MDIAALSMGLAQAELSTQVGVKVMSLMKDQMEVAGQGLIEEMKAMEISVNPNVGSHIDIKL